MQNVIDSLNQTITECNNRLSVQVLDGSPYLLVLTVKKDGTEPFKAVYGHWGDVKGFKCAELIADHLCGTFQFSPDSANRNAAAMRARGEEVEVMHWRTFLTARLERTKALLAMVTEALAKTSATA